MRSNGSAQFYQFFPKEDSMSEHTPDINPDDGQHHVDPAPSDQNTGITYPNDSAGCLIDHGNRGSAGGYFDSPGGGSGGSMGGVLF